MPTQFSIIVDGVMYSQDDIVDSSPKEAHKAFMKRYHNMESVPSNALAES